jgi:hypothetical protein
MIRALRRGAILRHAGHHSVAWQIDPPAGFALHAQAAPLHRAQISLRGDDLAAIGLPGAAWVIDTRLLRAIIGRPIEHAMCHPALIARIEATIRRAAAAEQAEAWHAPLR